MKQNQAFVVETKVFFLVRPAGRTHLRVSLLAELSRRQVPYRPDRGELLAGRQGCQP
ncbi:MAG: hypothetical protein KAS66_16515 [Candidatus Omnitrophica bacterium]|nr:hypothetical protein [Candidatus Omnitrophota bacterium]